MEKLTIQRIIEPAETYTHYAHPEAPQGYHEDVDDYIFAGESWRPSER